ncbi:hypothetical protein HWD72_12290 [Enterococcus hirae]|uniref:hypothetical protein n=1 Tax=Enterococcus TaxID=1350 RepID=UPI0013E40E87|nr:hypothetical protein [Enterococcus hirae]EMF0093350.1 hypothetical protein [Enterococcus hirae]EMF0097928.1 hypothetical protein [Enterococcus hirae]MBA5252328.1 hypothetical protein [Enterococcus hirae]
MKKIYANIANSDILEISDMDMETRKALLLNQLLKQGIVSMIRIENPMIILEQS